MGPTLVAYLRGARVGAVGTVEATMAAVAVGIVGALWLAATGAVGVATAEAVGGGATAAAVGGGVTAAAVGGGATAAAAAVSRPGLDPLIGEGEEWLHPGLEAVPSACLNHAWAGEGKKTERMGGGGGGGGFLC